MPSFCAVSNCEFKYSHSGNISFHKFPFHNAELLAVWISFTDRGPNWLPSRWSSICSQHFLPTDFRDHVYRKCLKRTAVPSVIVKRLYFPTSKDNTKANNIVKARGTTLYTGDKMEPIVCRLCASSSLDWNYQSHEIDNNNIILLLSKCFPNISLHRLDNMPNTICIDCVGKLKEFSEFLDRVIAVQSQFRVNNSNDVPTDESTQLKDIQKQPIIIKQEPVVNVKQEIIDSNKMTINMSEGSRTPTIESSESTTLQDTLLENDAFCEHCDANFSNNIELKKHILQFHSSDRSDLFNNSEIMEIITLENGCIDLVVEDEECLSKGTNQLKVEEDLTETTTDLSIFILLEHNYTKIVCENEEGSVAKVDETKRYVKREEGTQSPKCSVDFEAYESSIPEQIGETLTMLSCLKCNAQFNSQGNLDTHHNVWHSIGQKPTCLKCSSEYETAYDYLVHRREYHSKSKVRAASAFRRTLYPICPDCSQIFQTKLALNNHKRFTCLEPHHGLSFKCKYCSMHFKKWISMRKHSSDCRRDSKKIEIKTEQTVPAIEEGTLIDDKPVEVEERAANEQLFPCGQCDRSYNRRCNLYRHQRKHRPIVEWDQKCELCGITFDHRFDLKRHIKSKKCPAIINNESKIVKTDLDNQYKCSICSKCFRSAKNFYQHRLTHSTARNYHCKLCDKSFKRLSGLNQHIRGFHHNIKPYKCEVCNHSYVLKGDLKRCKHSKLKKYS